MNKPIVRLYRCQDAGPATQILQGLLPTVQTYIRTLLREQYGVVYEDEPNRQLFK